MSMAEQLPLADVKNRLSEVVDRVQREHDRVVITKHGRPAAVVLSVEDLESLEETLEILSDPTVLADIREAEFERSKRLTKKLSKDQALARTPRAVTGDDAHLRRRVGQPCASGVGSFAGEGGHRRH